MQRTVSWTAGFLIGAFAMMLMIVLTMGIGALTGALALSDLAADRFTSVVPITIFSSVLDSLKFKAKPLLELGILAGQVLVGGLIGAGFVWAVRRRGRIEKVSGRAAWWRRGGMLAAGLWLFCELVFLPLMGDGPFGVARTPALGVFHVALLLEVALYSLVLNALLVRQQRAQAVGDTPDGATIARRAMLANVAMGVGAVGLGAWAMKSLAFKPSPQLGFADEEGMQADLTPVADFYQVSKNFVNPTVDASTWKLQVGGLVDNPRSYTYKDILALPGAVEQYGTLECISNEVGGDLISNGLWKGVRLVDLLEVAGVKPGAKRLVLTADDGYTDSFPMEKALQPTVLLAYQLDGQPLTADHGFPLRLIVPGIYGMKNVKWITKIEPSDNEGFLGYWEERGWSNEARVKTMSRIDVPKAGAAIPAGLRHVGGIAFSGDRGIAKVEVSTDAGKTWQEADLKPPLGPFTWALWQLDWNATPGTHDLVVRATDKTGALQAQEEADPVPDGSSGYHKVRVTVVQSGQ